MSTELNGKVMAAEAITELRSHWNQESLEQLKASLTLVWKVARPTFFLVMGTALYAYEVGSDLTQNWLAGTTPEGPKLLEAEAEWSKNDGVSELQQLDAVDWSKVDTAEQIDQLSQQVDELLFNIEPLVEGDAWDDSSNDRPTLRDYVQTSTPIEKVTSLYPEITQAMLADAGYIELEAEDKYNVWQASLSSSEIGELLSKASEAKLAAHSSHLLNDPSQPQGNDYVIPGDKQTLLNQVKEVIEPVVLDRPLKKKAK